MIECGSGRIFLTWVWEIRTRQAFRFFHPKPDPKPMQLMSLAATCTEGAGWFAEGSLQTTITGFATTSSKKITQQAKAKITERCAAYCCQVCYPSQSGIHLFFCDNENYPTDTEKDKLKDVCKVHFMRAVRSAPHKHNTSQKTRNSITIFLFFTWQTQQQRNLIFFKLTAFQQLLSP